MSRPLTPVHLVTLGCARNEVDSEELAGRLAADGFTLVDDPTRATVVVVNTCGFIDAAKKDSVDTLLAASDLAADGIPRAVVAVGCLAERYGSELAASLPEADAVLGFDDYPDIAQRLRSIIDGNRPPSHQPRDRRTLLPLAPRERNSAPAPSLPGHGQPKEPVGGPRVLRHRLDGGATAPLKIASGCDRRCAFCAIPSFRGSYLSRRPAEILDEADWLVGQGVREVVLVSENSSSYGKDLGSGFGLPALLAELDGVEGLEWIRVSYLQPAEVRPDLVDALCGLERVVPWIDLPFQHASAAVLRRMRRFGDPGSFLGLLQQFRDRDPGIGFRSNVIVGFPGETEGELALLADFLAAAELDAVGVFGYSDEEGTEASTLSGKLSEAEIADRVDAIASLVEEVSSARAADRVGERVQVLVEDFEDGWVGRSAHQGPETDGQTSLRGTTAGLSKGSLVWGKVKASEGVDLIAELEVR